MGGCCTSSDERKQDSARLKQEQSLHIATLETIHGGSSSSLGTTLGEASQLALADAVDAAAMKEVQDDGTEKENPNSARGQASESGAKQAEPAEELPSEPANDVEPESEP